MKKSLIVLTLLLALGMNAEVAAQKHRHNPNVTMVDNVNDNGNDNDSTGIVAYSDTTSVDSTAFVRSIPIDDDDWDDDSVIRDLKNAIGVGVGGTIIATLAILFVLLVCLAPFIAIVLIIWLIVKNRNQRLRLAEKAMEQGQPIPSEALKSTPQPTDSDLWEKGLRNLFLGLGLFVCGYFFLGDLLKGIGAVMVFYGAGQAVIARTSGKKRSPEDIIEEDFAPKEDRKTFYEEFRDREQ